MNNNIEYNNKNYIKSSYIESEEDRKVREYNMLMMFLFLKVNFQMEKNEEGKEYKYGKIIFKDEFSSGKRNGKRKEYIFEKILFDVEYLNWKRLNGKGYNGNINAYKLKNGKEYLKEYYYNGNLEFEGEYLNGNRWNWKRYDKSAKKVYEFKNGKGQVKEYDYYGDFIFEGEYLFFAHIFLTAIKGSKSHFLILTDIYEVSYSRSELFHNLWQI